MEYFQMIIALIGVLALVFAVFWIMKMLNTRTTLYSSKNMRILERINLGPDKMLLLVSICGKCMVLGVTSAHTEKICDLEETEEELTAITENTPSFKESLRVVMENFKKKK